MLQGPVLEDPTPFKWIFVPNMVSSSWKWINRSGNWLYKQSSCVFYLIHSSSIMRLQHLTPCQCKVFYLVRVINEVLLWSGYVSFDSVSTPHSTLHVPSALSLLDDTCYENAVLHH